MLEDKELKDGMALIKKMDNRLEQIEKGLSQINKVLVNTPEETKTEVPLKNLGVAYLDEIVRLLTKMEKNVFAGVHNQVIDGKHLKKIKDDIVIGVNNTNVLNDNLIALNQNLLLFFNQFKDNASIWLYELSKRR